MWIGHNKLAGCSYLRNGAFSLLSVEGRGDDSALTLCCTVRRMTLYAFPCIKSLQLASAGFGPACARDRPSAWWLVGRVIYYIHYIIFA